MQRSSRLKRVSPDLLRSLANDHRAAGRLKQAERCEVAAVNLFKSATGTTVSPAPAVASNGALVPVHADSARARFLAVASSEHFKGNEARAVDYLKTSATAEQIIGLLAFDAKNAAKASEKTPKTLNVAKAVSTARGASSAPEKPKEDHSASWARVIAKRNEMMGFAA